MNRKLKILGTAVLAVLAMSIVASAAQASLFTSESGLYPAVAKGTQEGAHTFTIGTKTLTCAEVKFAGELRGASNELTMDPTYTECHTVVLGTTFDEIVTGFKHTGGTCDFNFTATANSIHLVCPTGDITIDIYNCSGVGCAHTEANITCQYTIKPQTIPGAIFDNVLGDVRVTTKEINVAYTRVKGTALACGPESGNAVYNGTTYVEGFDKNGSPTNFHVK